MNVLLKSKRPRSWSWLLLGAVGLLATYVMQHWLNVFGWLHGNFVPYSDRWNDIPQLAPWQFEANKFFRYLLNDLFSIALLYGYFGRTDFVRVAFGVLGLGVLVLLPVYFALVDWRPEGYSNLISHLHRVIMNPVLMMLLFPAFLLHERREQLGSAESHTKE